MKRQFSSPTLQKIIYNKPVSNASKLINVISTSLFFVEDKVNPFVFYGRAVVFIGIVVWRRQFINMDFINNPNEIGNSFVHRINLVFMKLGMFFPCLLAGS